MSNLQVVLVEPAGPLNVGSVARVMKNLGFSSLVLVNPRCDPQGPEARQMAVHAADLLDQIQVVTSLPAALSASQRVIGTTGRSDPLPVPPQSPELGLGWLVELDAGKTSLVFGPEDRGLSRDELAYCQRFVTIPTSSAYTSLNLAQAVAICCYELQRLSQNSVQISAAVEQLPGQLPQHVPEQQQAEIAALEDYFAELQTTLLKIGYLYPHTVRSRMAKFRALLNRAHPTATEVTMLRGILRQLDWALSHPTELGDCSREPREE
ncbi:RNA methyltransferase [Leptolyngbya sp. FACHB-261]|nr:RNA methyltransferase [Leptolyngbya sp. FACHB-261]